MTDPKPFGYVRDAAGGPMIFQHEPFDAITHLACSTAQVYSYAQLQAAMKAEREAAADLIEAECARILAQQSPEPVRWNSTEASVNLNLRMTAVMLPGLAAAIRARGEG